MLTVSMVIFISFHVVFRHRKKTFSAQIALNVLTPSGLEETPKRSLLGWKTNRLNLPFQEQIEGFGHLFTSNYIQGISYTKLANLPPIFYLYSSFVPLILYVILGSSRHLGSVSIASLVMGLMLEEAVSPAGNPKLYLKLAFTSTFFVGVFQSSLGLLRLGFIIDFLSKATLIEFMTGAA